MGHEPIDTKAVCGVRVDGYLSSHLVDPDSIGRQSTHAYGHARWDVTMNECVAHVDEAVNVWHRVGRRNPVCADAS